MGIMRSYSGEYQSVTEVDRVVDILAEEEFVRVGLLPFEWSRSLKRTPELKLFVQSDFAPLWSPQ